MANLYIMSNPYGKGLINDKTDLNSMRPNYSLFELLTSDGEFLVEGIRVMRRGSPEWDEDIASFRKNLERNRRLSTQEIEEIVNRSSADDVRTGSTPFDAMHYRKKRLIHDWGIGVIGEISIARRQIDFFHYAGRLSDMAYKAGTYYSYGYDGSLCDALEEFEHEGYTFNLLNLTWNPDLIENGERRAIPKSKVSFHYKAPTKCVSLKPILLKTNFLFGYCLTASL